MIIKGKIAAINRNNEMYAIETDGYGVTIIELTTSFELSMGDVMSWTSGTAHGHNLYSNITTGKSEYVYVQAHWVSKSKMRKHIGLKN